MHDLQSLSQLFSNKLFRIPDYQRGYAWKKDQLVDFWDDLINLNPKKYHYTGLLSFKTINKMDIYRFGDDQWMIEKGFQVGFVVDGQQRLTTFIILLNELINFAKSVEENKGKSEHQITLNYQPLNVIRSTYISQKKPPEELITTYIFGYDTDNPSDDYLKLKVLGEPFGGTVNETYYTRNLHFAKGFFSECLSSLYKAEGYIGLEEIYRKLTLRLMFNVHEIEDDYDVFVAFETMNNRGKKLTNLELLKNRLIYLTTIFSDTALDEKDKGKLRKDINATWKEIYFQLGRNPHTPLSDDEFLRAHWIIYYQYTRKGGDDYIKFLLSKFSAKNIYIKQDVAVPEEDTDIPENTDSDDDSEPDSEPVTEGVLINSLTPKEIAGYVNSLKETAQSWYYTYFPNESPTLSYEEIVWIDKLNRIGINYFRPLVAVSLNPKVICITQERIELFKAIERFIFLCFRMAGYSASYKSSEYYRKARELSEGKIQIAEIIAEINALNLVESEFAVNYFMNRIKKKFSTGVGFYGWSDLRYFLFEYEEDLAATFKNKKIEWSKYTRIEKDKVSIEHILPQTPTKFYWRNQFRQYSDNEIKILSATLGNLLPLDQSINSSLQNDSFPDKKTAKTGLRPGYLHGSHAEIEVSKELDWDARRIFERGIKLLKFMEKRWGIQFKDEEQMIELLHLKFVLEPKEDIPPLDEEDFTLVQVNISPSDELTTGEKQLAFWTAFSDYCHSIGRGTDLAKYKPIKDNYYDRSIPKKDYHAFMTIGGSVINVGIYFHCPEAYHRLIGLKDQIEAAFGNPINWIASKAEKKQRRILFSTTANPYLSENYQVCFDWLIEYSDKLTNAVLACDQ